MASNCMDVQQTDGQCLYIAGVDSIYSTQGAHQQQATWWSVEYSKL